MRHFLRNRGYPQNSIGHSRERGCCRTRKATILVPTLLRGNAERIFNSKYAFPRRSVGTSIKTHQRQFFGLCFSRKLTSSGKAKMHYIPILHHIGFAFKPHLALFFGICFTAQLHEILITYHLSSDKSLFKIRVDNPCSLGG